MSKHYIVESGDEVGSNWMICSTGTDEQDGKLYTVTTNQVPGSQLGLYTNGAKSDAELICKLLNMYGNGDIELEDE